MWSYSVNWYKIDCLLENSSSILAIILKYLWETHQFVKLFLILPNLDDVALQNFLKCANPPKNAVLKPLSTFFVRQFSFIYEGLSSSIGWQTDGPRPKTHTIGWASVPVVWLVRMFKQTEQCFDSQSGTGQRTLTSKIGPLNEDEYLVWLGLCFSQRSPAFQTCVCRSGICGLLWQ